MLGILTIVVTTTTTTAVIIIVGIIILASEVKLEIEVRNVQLARVGFDGEVFVPFVLCFRVSLLDLRETKKDGEDREKRDRRKREEGRVMRK